MRRAGECGGYKFDQRSLDSWTCLHRSHLLIVYWLQDRQATHFFFVIIILLWLSVLLKAYQSFIFPFGWCTLALFPLGTIHYSYRALKGRLSINWILNREGLNLSSSQPCQTSYSGLEATSLGMKTQSSTADSIKEL